MGPLGHNGLGPTGPPRALMFWALMGILGFHGQETLGPNGPSLGPNPPGTSGPNFLRKLGPPGPEWAPLALIGPSPECPPWSLMGLG